METIMETPFLFIFPQLGLPELSIIVLLVLILFGPGKLPGVMKSLGDGVKQFKEAASGSSAHAKAEESDRRPE